MVDYRSLKASYSSHVVMTLVAGGMTLPVAKMAEGYVVLRDPVALPRCDGELRISVDGREHSWRVTLDNGAVPFDATVTIREI
jgi:hypothetical protein